jgi:hypothetical protein
MERLWIVLRENGGPAGCARQFVAITKKNQSCIVYPGMPELGLPYLIVHRAASIGSQS